MEHYLYFLVMVIVCFAFYMLGRWEEQLYWRKVITNVQDIMYAQAMEIAKLNKILSPSDEVNE